MMFEYLFYLLFLNRVYNNFLIGKNCHVGLHSWSYKLEIYFLENGQNSLVFVFSLQNFND
jgi:hypothetical protein